MVIYFCNTVNKLCSMKKRVGKSLIFFCVMLLSLSCDTTDNSAKQLKNYLRENFNLEAKAGDLYLFIPACLCEKCFEFDGANLSESLNKRLHIFSAYPPEKIKSFINYHYDPDEKLKHLMFTGYNNQLVSMDNNRVNTVCELTSF